MLIKYKQERARILKNVIIIIMIVKTGSLKINLYVVC